MTVVIHPRVSVQILNSQPSGPAGSTKIIPPLPSEDPQPPATWSPLVQGLNSGNVNADFRDVASDGNNFVAVGDSGRAAHSVDGTTWTALPQGLNSGLATAAFKTVRAAQDGTFIVSGSAGWSARSLDGGLTWAAAPQGLGSGGNNNFASIATDGAGNWIAVAQTANVGYSLDNGGTWNNGGAVIGAGTPNYWAIDYFGTSAIVVCANGIAGITGDNGVTFGGFLSPQGLNSGFGSTVFNSVRSQGQTLVVGGEDQFCALSLDGGGTWASLPLWLNSGNNMSNIFMKLDGDGFNNFFCVQRGGWTAISIDGGVSWAASIQGLNSGSPTANFTGIATNKNGTWVAVAEFGWASVGTA